MFRTKTKAELAKERAEVAREKAEAARERAQELAQERAAEFSAAASERFQAAKEAARETAAPALAEAAEAAKLKLAAAREAAGPVMHDMADRAKPRIEAAQSSLLDDMLPKVGAVLAAAAASLAEAGEHAKDAAAPKVEHAREEAHVYNDRAKDALRVFRGEAVAVEAKRSKAPWLIGIGLAAAVVAALAAFRKKQQADDPWATPLTDTYQPTFKEKAAEKVEQAKEVVSDTAAKAKETASDLAAKGQAAVADAKDRSGEDTTTLESGFEDEGLEGGQVSAVEGQPGADAVPGSGTETTEHAESLVEALEENAAQTGEGQTSTSASKRTTKSTPKAGGKS